MVVDDHPLYRRGVAHAFQSSDRFELAGEGETAAAAIALVAEHDPDLLFLDLQLPGGGLEAAGTILAAKGRTRIVVLSIVDDIKVVVRAFQLGVSGYLLKCVSGADLIRTAEAVFGGEQCVAPQLMGQLLDHLSGRAQVSPARAGASRICRSGGADPRLADGGHEQQGDRATGSTSVKRPRSTT